MREHRSKSVKEGDSKSVLFQNQVMIEHKVLNKHVIEGVSVIDSEQEHAQKSEGSYPHQSSRSYSQQNRRVPPT